MTKTDLDPAASSTEEARERRFGAVWGTAIGVVLIAALFLAYCDNAPDDVPSGSLAGAGATLSAADVAAEIDAPTGVGLSVENGIVTLIGEVKTETTKARLGNDALGIPGVVRVDNQLVIASSETADDGGTGDDTATGGGDTDDGGAMMRTEQPAVSISLVDGIVTMRGVLATRAQADDLVARVEQGFGRGNVVDELTVADDVFEEPWVAGVGEFMRFAEVENIEVDAFGGVAVLRGEVGSEEIKMNLGDLARESMPDLEIRNELTVTGPTDEEVADEAQDELDEALELENITFETGSAQITAEGQAVLDEVAVVLGTFDQIVVEIQGHTDSQGGAAGNLDLSQRRADAVLAYLEDKGIAVERMTAVGFGEDVPIADNGTAEGRAQNRRIEFVVQQ